MSNLKTIVDEKSYRQFRGADWPTYENFINNNYTVSKSIKSELDKFVLQMQERYKDLATHRTEELSQANQERQKQVFYDKEYAGSHCQIPWNTLGVNTNGNVFICESPSWIPIFVGNLFECDSIYDILNSDSAKKIRQEILAGRYYYCNSRICGFFDFKDTTKYKAQPTDNIDPLEFVDHEKLYVDQIPTNLIFDFDYTCNFKCPSCRTEYQNWNNDHIIRPINSRIVESIKHLIIDKIEEQPITIRWCGGEPFMSEVYIELFEYIITTNKSNIQNVIQTNGSLFLAKKDLVTRLLPFISDIRISFDAGSEEVYRMTRIGGNWDNLIKNVKFLLDVVRKNNFKTKVSADYVVQKNNYEDLPRYVELCKELGIEINQTQKMWNWGTWDEETFKAMNAYHPAHEEYNKVKEYFKLARLPMAKN